MPALPSLPRPSLVVMVVVVVVVVPAEACLKRDRQVSSTYVIQRTFVLAPRQQPQTPRRTDDLARVHCLIDVCYLSLDHPKLCQDTFDALRTSGAVEPCNDTCAAQVTGVVCRHPIVVQYLLHHYDGMSCGQQWEAIFWSNGSGTNTTTTTITANTTTTTMPATPTTRRHQARTRDQKDATLITTKTTAHHHHHHHHLQRLPHPTGDTKAFSSAGKQTLGGGHKRVMTTTQNTRTNAPQPEETKPIDASKLCFNGRREICDGSLLASSEGGGGRGKGREGSGGEGRGGGIGEEGGGEGGGGGEEGGGRGKEEEGGGGRGKEEEEEEEEEGGGGGGGKEAREKGLESLPKSMARNKSNSEVDWRRKSVKERKSGRGEKLKKQDLTRREEKKKEKDEEEENDRHRKRKHTKEQNENMSPYIHVHVKNIHNGTQENTGFSAVVVWLSVVVVVVVVVVVAVSCGLLAWLRLHACKRSFYLH
ncbi:uncharacterized protein LOC127005839 [Eriocheir sinensis]|uniref:uncharacterized protein LOC127005839 n=1 Tax=Eriocheir sinensis TaxID=95602 RepID=UPI0021C5BD0D|nr:uncharacterized protein LOC127005839 [Eriocheir sinensis]XP_050730984.1 uncharacterized protein LOC127005839 [Eriocheir sinensis]XP_050730985.1 uncharacterized protein LOC127005839 [Eriocheir sinensis]